MSVPEPGRKRAPWSLRFRDDVQLIDRQIVQDLHRSGRPTNGDPTQALIAQPEMQAPIVLTTESRSSVHHLALARVAELRRHLGADGAAIAPRSDELELDPVLTPRPSSRSVTPASCATSTNPAWPRLSSTRERSYPDRLALPIGGQFFASSKMLPCAPAILDIAYQ